jgi:hypothetical protein
LTRYLGSLAILAIPLALMIGAHAINAWLGPMPPPRTPADREAAAYGASIGPIQIIGGLAFLCWAAIALLVFLAPLILLVLWIAS